MGSDIALSATGDLLGVSGAPYTQQRVLRRLLTNPGAYIWHIPYGAGLPRFVGEVANGVRIAAVIRRQMALEKGVARSPPPAVTVDAQPTGIVTARVTYADLNGTPQKLVVTP